jgi:hypothetical protein
MWSSRTVPLSVTPEPGTFALVGGLTALAAIRRRRPSRRRTA